MATTLQSVRRAMRVLELIATTPGVTPKDIARECGLELASTYHLVNTLIETGYVEKSDRELFATTRLVELGEVVESHLRPDPVGIAAMTALRDATLESTYLSEWQRGDIVAIASVEGSRPVRVGAFSVGERGNAHARSSGKVLLAYGPRERLDGYLTRGPLLARTAKTITDPAVLRKELRRVREDGFAVDRGEYIEDVYCVSAPLFIGEDVVRYGISTVVPATRFDRDQALFIAETLRIAEAASAGRSLTAESAAS